MANTIKEPWNDPAKSFAAANGTQQLVNLLPVMLVGIDGEPYKAGDITTGDVFGEPLRGDIASFNSIPSSLTSTTLASVGVTRISISIVNDGTSILYIKLGGAVSTTAFSYKLYPEDTLIVDDYTGQIVGIWDIVNGNALITEITKTP